MKKKCLLLALFMTILQVDFVNAGTPQKGNAQQEKPFTIGCGLTAGLPEGDYSELTSLALAFDVQGEYALIPNLRITLSTGYLNFISKSGYGDLGIGQIPLLVGGKYCFSNKVYGSLQTGVSILTEEGAGTAFAIVPGIGYKINKTLDLMLKYQSASVDETNISFLGIRAGFTF